MNEHDLEIFAKTLFGECRGEPREGQIAVANVILNRFKSKKWFSAKTIAGVCQKPFQFSCWNSNDPNAQKLANLLPSKYKPFYEIILEAKLEDLTNGATHYCTKAVVKKTVWAQGKKPCCEIGNHLFFNNVE